jgi:hypothetical protein
VVAAAAGRTFGEHQTADATARNQQAQRPDGVLVARSGALGGHVGVRHG